MLKRITGKPKIEWFPKTASTVIHNGQVVILTSGQLVAATATSLQLLGTILLDVLAADADYTGTKKVPVDVGGPDDIFEADVKAGVTAAASGVGSQCDLYVTGNETYVDTGTNSHHQVTIVDFVSASKVLVKINSNPAYLPAA